MSDQRDSPARRNRRPTSGELAEVFGDVLPEITVDERECDSAQLDTADSWYLRNRPPHHDS